MTVGKLLIVAAAVWIASRLFKYAVMRSRPARLIETRYIAPSLYLDDARIVEQWNSSRATTSWRSHMADQSPTE